MKIKQFHEDSELEMPADLQPSTIVVEQKLTQAYLAQLATDRYQSMLRWNHTERIWHFYDHESKLWERISPERVIAILMETLAEMRSLEAKKVRVSGSSRGSVIKEIESAERYNFLSGTEHLMRSMSSLSIDGTAFDADPYLVGLDDGQVLDLRTNDTRPLKQTDYLTKRINAPHIFGASCPLWEKCILEWACGDKELARFLQVWAGYCLSGLTSFQGFLFLYGSGRNGKSVFLNVISKLLGDYSLAMKSDTLMQRNSSGGASGDIARLHGVRFVTCNELPEGKHFDEELLKMLTGGDTITARFLYKEDFNFKPLLKLMISGNHQPVIKGTDNGMWRRVHLVPFLATITNDDPALTYKLMQELSGILNWCVEGWKIFLKEGIVIPKNVSDATALYRSDMDIIGQWLDEYTKPVKGTKATLKNLYRSYVKWCDENGFRTITSKAFNRKLKDGRLGEPVRDGAGFYYPNLEVECGSHFEETPLFPINQRLDVN